MEDNHKKTFLIITIVVLAVIIIGAVLSLVISKQYKKNQIITNEEMNLVNQLDPKESATKETVVQDSIIDIGLGASGTGILPADFVIPNNEEVQEQITKQVDIDPLENLPEANPFEKETNPFKEKSYKNPFD